MHSFFTSKKLTYKAVSQNEGKLDLSNLNDENLELANINSNEVNERQRHRLYIRILFGLIFGALVVAAFAIAAYSPAKSCKHPRLRNEWRKLSQEEQHNYLEAITCLMDKPSLIEPGTSRWDDFAYGHTKQGAINHYSGYFLTWHRFLLAVHEQTLRNECGFKGTVPLVQTIVHRCTAE
jgi:hypothetical protein